MKTKLPLRGSTINSGCTNEIEQQCFLILFNFYLNNNNNKLNIVIKQSYTESSGNCQHVIY